MPKRLTQFFLSAYCLVLSAIPAWSQSSNATYTLMQETITSGGGQIGGGNPMQAQTALGLPIGGSASNGTFTVLGGAGMMPQPGVTPITMTITVTGSVSDPAATVTINGKPASVSGTTFSAPVELLLGPNTMTAQATDALGNTASVTITVILDLPAEQKEPRFSITVQGAVDDPTAVVTVNEAPAVSLNGQFSASVPVTSGLNTLRAVATDSGENSASVSIRVFVPPATSRPPMPTVGTVGDPLPAVTTQSSITVGGTKTAGTSIWINGQQQVALGDATTWTVTIPLVEGDNRFAIVAKDTAGTSSAAVTVNIVVDTVPPVITLPATLKTNLNPFPLTGQVDDSLTRVRVGSVDATNTMGVFTATVPLTQSQTTLTVTATSPNGFTATKTVTVTLGTIPTLQVALPADGSKLYAGAAVTLQASASDAEGDPIQFHFAIDGTPMADWAASSSMSWTPAQSATGQHTVTIRARDDYGGSADRHNDVWVLRSPVQHP